MFSLPWNTVLILLVMAFIPSMGWLMLYRYLDSRDPEPRNPTILAVLLGVMSTFPVFGMQYIFRHFPSLDVITFLRVTFLTPMAFTTSFLVFVAFIEEVIKGLAFIIVIRRYEKVFNQVVDGIFYAALVGIGFALAENIYYLSKAWMTFSFNGSFIAILSIRSFGTMLAHTLFTGIFGFYFAKSYFAPFIDKKSKKEKLWKNLGANLKQAVKLHTTFMFLLPGIEKGNKTIKRNAMIFEGLFVAMILHFLYNGMIKLEVFGKNWTVLIIPLIFMMAWYVWSRFFVKIFVLIIDFIKTKRDLYRVKVK